VNIWRSLSGRLRQLFQIAGAVNATVIPLEDAPQGYQEFDKGAAKKYALNPNSLIAD
jgi:glutathione-independent formaldehyde dehydrogenase